MTGPTPPCIPDQFLVNPCAAPLMYLPRGCSYLLGPMDLQNFHPSSSHSIPMTLLSRQDPVLDQILFYEDVPLFEDELHDNGESILNVRIVSPRSFPFSLDCTLGDQDVSASCRIPFSPSRDCSYESIMFYSAYTMSELIMNSDLKRL